MLIKIKSVEINAWSSIIKHILDTLPLVYNDYNLNGKNIQVVPSYPKDLTKFSKPSIIVQKIHTSQSDTGFGRGYMGQHYDSDENLYVDVYGEDHTMIYQINVEATNNSERDNITSALCECIFDEFRHFDLCDFVADKNNPPIIGNIDRVGDIEVTPLSSNENQDYSCIIRLTFNVVRTIVPNDDIVDLSKPINIIQHISNRLRRN